MQAINNKYVLVKRIEDTKTEGFQTIEVQDSFIYKGQVHRTPDQPVYVDNKQVAVGDKVIFAKYSPDTHEIDVDGVKMKMVKGEDLLTVI